jgi:hypothetical protein
MTLALAIIGATTGIVALLAQVWQFVLAGPRVKVSVANVLTTPDGNWWLGIDVTNTGRLPVTIADVGVLVERRGKEPGSMPYGGLHPSHRSGPDLQHRLIDGDSVTFLMFPGPVAGELATEKARQDVKAYARLGTNKRLESRKRVVNVWTLAQQNGRP